MLLMFIIISMKSIVMIYLYLLNIVTLGGLFNLSEINDFMSNISSFNIYFNGQIKSVEENENFEMIMGELEDIFLQSHEMPAFGVAIDDEVRKELNLGLWLEIVYNNSYTHNEMMFQKLLIKIEKDSTGFNMIRYYDDKYDGRCFYIDLLDDDLSQLYLILENII